MSSVICAVRPDGLHRCIAICLVVWALVFGPVGSTNAQDTPAAWTYPPAHRGDVVDDYFGVRVPDPYRWLEDTDTYAFLFRALDMKYGR